MGYDREIFAFASMMHFTTNNSWLTSQMWAGDTLEADIQVPCLHNGTIKKASSVLNENQGGGGSTNRLNIRLSAVNTGHEIFWADTELDGAEQSITLDVNFTEGELVDLLRQRTGTGRRVDYFVLGEYT